MAVTRDNIAAFALRSSGVVLFLFLWQLAPTLEWVDPYFVPPLSRVLQEIGVLLQEGSLAVHLLVSVWRAVAGLLLALAIGLPAGFLLARRYRELAEAIDPILRVFSQVNPFTLMPVFLLFFGVGETAKVAMVAWVAVWPVLFYGMTGAREVDPVQIRSAAAMGASPAELLLKVIIPGALPTAFVGIRIAAGLTFYILIAAEMLGAGAGLGWLVHNSAMNYLVPRIYAGAFFIVLLGFLLNRALIWLERVLFIWRDETAIPAQSAASAAVPWRPGRYAASALAGSLLAILLIGGIAVQRINQAAANPEGGHSRHFGTPVDSGGSSF